MISTTKFVISLLFASAANASRFGLLRVGVPSNGASSLQSGSKPESSRSLIDEDFQLVYRQLIGYSSTSDLSLSMAPLSMAPFSMAPFSMAPFSMAQFSMAQMSMAPFSMGSPTWTPNLGAGSTGSDSTRDNNNDSTQGPTGGTSENAFNAGLTGGLAVAGVAFLVAAALYKVKRSTAAASSQQSVVSDESSVPSLPSAV